MDRLGNKIVSQRTIQRQAVAQAQHIMATTSAAVTDEDVSSDVSYDPVQISSSERSVNTHAGNIPEDSIHVHNFMSDDDLESILHTSEELIDEVHDSESHDLSSSDEDDNPTFKEQLREWVLNSGTPICHVNSLLALLQPHFPSLPKDGRTLLNTRREYVIDNIAGGKYHHFGVEHGIKICLQQYAHLCDLDELSLQLNIDGVPLFKSSSESFWPILGLLQQEQKSEPFIIGLWIGHSKPKDPNAFLQKFIDEMSQIEMNGICYNDKTYRIKIANFICDTPARSFVKQSKGHSGYYGCDYCVQTGVYYMHRMTFPERNAPLRTDVMFDEMDCEEHHTGETLLRQLNVGLVSQFPLDYMHLICLGIMKKMLGIWSSGPLHVRLGHNTIKSISESILKLKQYLPREFVRKGRTLNEIDRWKATEFRTFLLYTGPVILKERLSDVLYKNFLMLFVGITILSSATFCSQYCDYADELLKLFVGHFEEAYGKEMIVYNVHALTHLASHCKLYGAVDKFSAFPFENFLQSIKKLVRKPHLPLEQVIRRVAEKMIIKKQKNEGKIYCKKKHNSGPIPDGINACSQYEQLHMNNETLSIKRPDNVVQINGEICIIRNIVIYDNTRHIICQKFRKKQPFFKYPLDSSKLNILSVCDLQQRILQFSPEDITAKIVLLPLNDRYIAIPMLQQ